MITKKFLKAIANLFFPLVEITVFDHKGEVEETINAFSIHKEDQEINRGFSENPCPEHLRNGKKVKTILVNLEPGYLRIRIDINIFSDLYKQLEDLLQPSKNVNIGNESWERLVDNIIGEYTKTKKITIEGASQKDKRELVTLLHKEGLFDYKEASAYIAHKINTSRATVYNYLKTATNLKKVRVHQVDAFTDKRFGGNPAGVVLDAEYLDEPTMKKLTRELNLSETAFVLPSAKADFRIRYFTPTGHEIGFCGHSTVGTLFTIAHEKRFGVVQRGTHRFSVETACGKLQMETISEGDDKIQVAYETPKIDLIPFNANNKTLKDAAGIQTDILEESYPLMYDKTTKVLFAVAKDLTRLEELEPDSKALAAFCKEYQCVVVCIFTTETFDKKHQFHMRCFAPMVGIPEDPFTGSVLGGLAAYAHQNGLLRQDQQLFWVEQGHFVDRPGFVKVEFHKENTEYKVKVFAQAVHCFTTEINIS